MDNQGKLSKEKYVQACELTQIVAIDLLVKNSLGEFLMGFRRNSPAKDTYFVPGGRVYKGESLSQALIRIAYDELGCVCQKKDFIFKGVFEHYYQKENPVSSNSQTDTHYIVFAFNLDMPLHFSEHEFSKQHSDIKYMIPEQVLDCSSVNQFSKMYFVDVPPNALFTQLYI